MERIQQNSESGGLNGQNPLPNGLNLDKSGLTLSKSKEIFGSCDRCRSNKRKCDQLRPSCTNCLKSSKAQKCHYRPHGRNDQRKPTLDLKSLPLGTPARPVNTSENQYKSTSETTLIASTSSLPSTTPLTSTSEHSLDVESALAQLNPDHQTTKLPLASIIYEDILPEEDPITLNIITIDVARKLYDFFYAEIMNISPFLEPTIYTFDYVRSHSTFLFTALLSQSAPFHPESNAEICQKLDSQVGKLTGLIFARGFKSVEIVAALAMLCNSLPPVSRPNMDRSWGLLGYAITLASELKMDKTERSDLDGTHLTQAEKIKILSDRRRSETMWLNLYSLDQALSATKVLRRHLSDDSPLIQSMFSSWLFVTIIRNLWSKDLERWIVEPGSRYLDRSKAALVLLRKIQTVKADRFEGMTDYEADMATQRLRISLIDAWQEKWFFHIIGELQTLYLINVLSSPERNEENSVEVLGIFQDRDKSSRAIIEIFIKEISMLGRLRYSTTSNAVIPAFAIVTLLKCLLKQDPTFTQIQTDSDLLLMKDLISRMQQAAIDRHSGSSMLSFYSAFANTALNHYTTVAHAARSTQPETLELSNPNHPKFWLSNITHPFSDPFQSINGTDPTIPNFDTVDLQSWQDVYFSGWDEIIGFIRPDVL